MISCLPPTGWKFPTLEEISLREKGAIRIGPFGSALKKHEYADAGVRVLGIEDVLPNKLTSERPKYIPSAKYQELLQYTVSPGDLLVTNMGTVGRACVVPEGLETAIISSHLIKMTPDITMAWPSYLSWMLNFCPLVVAQVKAKSHGAIMAGFNSGLLKSLRIPLPPLPEQRRIADVLDKAEALRAKRRAALAQLDELTQSIFIDMFGNPVSNPKRVPISSLGSIAEQVTDGEHLTPKRTAEGVKLLSARNIRDGHIDVENVDYIGIEEHERIKRRCNPSWGDVLISCSGTIGRVSSVETTESFSLVRSVALVRPIASLIRYKFLEHYLRTPALKARMVSRANASSQANLFQGQIRELPVFVPSIGVQDAFVARAAGVGALGVTHRESLTCIDALFASLQHRAFRGEL